MATPDADSKATEETQAEPFEVPADEARQRFGELLDRAMKGQTTTVTRHGKKVAQVCPVAA